MLKKIPGADLMRCVFTQTDAFDKRKETARRGEQHKLLSVICVCRFAIKLVVYVLYIMLTLI